jgi:hypothetical protein
VWSFVAHTVHAFYVHAGAERDTNGTNSDGEVGASISGAGRLAYALGRAMGCREIVLIGDVDGDNGWMSQSGEAAAGRLYLLLLTTAEIERGCSARIDGVGPEICLLSAAKVLRGGYPGNEPYN